jgi:hypothetical protein
MAKSAAIAGQAQATDNAIAEKMALSKEGAPVLPQCPNHTLRHRFRFGIRVSRDGAPLKSSERRQTGRVK